LELEIPTQAKSGLELTLALGLYWMLRKHFLAFGWRSGFTAAVEWQA
jgi:hypothetical protein